jgi:hypothetical protein
MSEHAAEHTGDNAHKGRHKDGTRTGYKGRAEALNDPNPSASRTRTNVTNPLRLSMSLINNERAPIASKIMGYQQCAVQNKGCRFR